MTNAKPGTLAMIASGVFLPRWGRMSWGRHQRSRKPRPAVCATVGRPGSSQAKSGVGCMTNDEKTSAGIELLHDFLAQRSRDRAVPLSSQIRAEAAAGDVLARRVVASGILNSPSPETPKPQARPTPPTSARQADRERKAQW